MKKTIWKFCLLLTIFVMLLVFTTTIVAAEQNTLLVSSCETLDGWSNNHTNSGGIPKPYLRTDLTSDSKAVVAYTYDKVLYGNGGWNHPDGVGTTPTNGIRIAYEAASTETVSYDLTDMTHLVFDLYVSNAKLIENKYFFLELTSSGKPDAEELSWRLPLISISGELIDGWNKIVISLDSYTNDREFDATQWDFLRIFNYDLIDLGDNELTLAFSNLGFVNDISHYFGIFYTLNESKNEYSVSACGDFKKIVIPSTYNGLPVTSVKEYGFSNCWCLENVTLPNSITNIGFGAFLGCSNLTSISLPFVGANLSNSENTHFGYIFGASFYVSNNQYVPSSLKEVYLTGGTEIADFAFYHCNNIVKITIPDTTTRIGKASFIVCDALTSINIPKNVNSIGDEAFSVCSSLAHIEVDSANTVYHSVDDCLIETQTKTLILGCKNSVIPTDGSVTSIYLGAFRGSAITNIMIPDDVVNIGVNAFLECHELEVITVDKNNTVYHSAGNCLIETASKTLITGCQSSVIPSDGSVTSIASLAFIKCNITNIIIPKYVTSIGALAFYNCSSLTSITFESPDTVIYDNSDTIPSTTTICGYEGSTAQVYAEKYGRSFEVIVDAQLTVESKVARVGSQIEVTVKLENNPGISFLAVTPSYDKSVMTLVSVTNGGIISDFDEGKNFIWSADDDATTNGTMLTMVFQIADEASVGDYAVDLIVRECYNEAQDDVVMTAVSGTVTVVDFIYGDVNNDRVINGKDILQLRKYLANYNYDTQSSTVVIGLGSDANGDGEISGKDILIIRKYLANYDYDTGESTVVLGPTA